DFAESLDRKQLNSVFFEVPNGKEVHLLECSKINLYDSAVCTLIEQSLREKTTHPIALYITHHYPRHIKFNWGLDGSTFNDYPAKEKNCILSLMYALGGTILGDIKQRSRINVFSLIRAQYPFIF